MHVIPTTPRATAFPEATGLYSHAFPLLLLLNTLQSQNSPPSSNIVFFVLGLLLLALIALGLLLGLRLYIRKKVSNEIQQTLRPELSKALGTPTPAAGTALSEERAQQMVNELQEKWTAENQALYNKVEWLAGQLQQHLNNSSDARATHKQHYQNTLTQLTSTALSWESPSPETISLLAEFHSILPEVKQEEDYDFHDFYFMAVASKYQGNNTEAISALSLAIQKDPLREEAYFYRGYTYNLVGEYELALEDFNKAIELAPNDAAAYNNRGNAWRLMENYEQAIDNFNNALELAPNLPVAFNNRGMVHLALDKAERAIADFEQAIALNPGYAEAIGNKGVAYDAQGKTGLALESFNQANAINPRYADPLTVKGNADWDFKQYQMEPYTAQPHTRPQVQEKDTDTYMNLAELLIMVHKPSEALNTLDEVDALTTPSPSHMLQGLYYRIICHKLLGNPTDPLQAEAKKLLDQGIQVATSSEALALWIANNSNLSEDEQAALKELGIMLGN